MVANQPTNQPFFFFFSLFTMDFKKFNNLSVHQNWRWWIKQWLPLLAVSEKQKPEINNDDDDVRPDVFKPWWILHSSFVMSEEKKRAKIWNNFWLWWSSFSLFTCSYFINWIQRVSRNYQAHFIRKKPDIFKANLLFCFVVEMFAIASKIHTATTLIRFCWLHGH